VDANPAVDPHALARLFGTTTAESWRVAASGPDPAPQPGPPVLIVGVPRSGTTWVGYAFARTAGASYLHEPDNPTVSLYAYAAKRGLGSYPYLEDGDRVPAYARCWEAAFTGDRPAPGWRTALTRRVERLVPPEARRVALRPGPARLPVRVRVLLALSSPSVRADPPGRRVVKSVHAGLSLGWIADRWHPRVLLVRRHPLDVVASWIDVEGGVEKFLHHDDEFLTPRARHDLSARLGVPEYPQGNDPVGRAAWLVGLLHGALEDTTRSLEGAVVVDHEVLCRDPVGELRFTARRCGLTWTMDAERFTIASQRPGFGYDLTRVAETLPGSWRRRLDPADLRVARRELERFPFADRYDGLTPG